MNDLAGFFHLYRGEKGVRVGTKTWIVTTDSEAIAEAVALLLDGSYRERTHSSQVIEVLSKRAAVRAIPLEVKSRTLFFRLDGLKVPGAFAVQSDLWDAARALHEYRQSAGEGERPATLGIESQRYRTLMGRTVQFTVPYLRID
ncbi:hypothetical protein ACIPV3_25035 [Streptomyces albidoflavus]